MGSLNTKVEAQTADVPRANANGDFFTTIVQGNRGTYSQVFWLVVDPDPNGLNCRAADGGDPLVILDYGSILKTSSEFDQTNAIKFYKGNPWLNVVITPLTFPKIDLRKGIERGRHFHCLVRASVDLIAPINQSAIDELHRIDSYFR